MSEFKLCEKTSMSVFLTLVKAIDSMADISQLPLPEEMRASAISPYVAIIKMITLMAMMDKDLKHDIDHMFMAKIPKFLETWGDIYKTSFMQESKSRDDVMFQNEDPESIHQAAKFIEELMKQGE